jgi:DNA (cytosine-5)-methyltransferase 1
VGSGPSVLSLCAGIGGLDLGIELAFPGARTVCFVEREASCIELLATRMEEGRLAPAPVWSDLKTFDGTAWSGRVDLVAAGYPCQPFSLAGKGLGDRDPRHLWPDVARVIQEVQPRVVVLENVQGHVKRGLKQVLLDLDGLGFDAEWGVYSASQAGAPHRRNRIFILAYCRSWGLAFVRSAHNSNASDAPRHNSDRCMSAVADPNSQQVWELKQRMPWGREKRVCGEGQSLSGHPSEAVADPSRERLQEWQGLSGDPCEERQAFERGCLRLFPPGPEGDWSEVPSELHPATQSSLCGMVDGVPVRVDQLRALGNAVVPQQCALALRDLIGRIA